MERPTAPDSTISTATPELPRTQGTAGGVEWRAHVVVCPDPARVGTVVALPPRPFELGRSGADWSADDTAMSRRHVTLHAGLGSVTIDDLHSRNGTFAGGRRVQRAVVGDGAVVRFGHTVAVLEADFGRARAYASSTANLPGRSERARLMRFDAELAARQPLHVLLTGQTGTGKEHAAAEIHRLSGRGGPLVRFNVAAVPAELFESELFGHVAGAFTGATGARLGRVREANRGTLVLDEIGELPPHLQPKLLRVLEENLLRPVGASADVAVDVRFVASTNADLDLLVDQGKFRRDLLARLRGAALHLPPLGERRPDLLDLADAAAPLPNGHTGRKWREVLTAEAAEALLLHNHPENLRNVRAALLRAAALAGRGPVGVEHLPEAMVAKVAENMGEPFLTAGPLLSAQETKRPTAVQLQHALQRHGGRVEAVAQHFGVHRRQVYRWMQYAGIARRAPADTTELA